MVVPVQTGITANTHQLHREAAGKVSGLVDALIGMTHEYLRPE